MDAAVQKGTCSPVWTGTWKRVTLLSLPFTFKLSSLVLPKWSPRGIIIDLEEARAPHLHKYSRSRAFWRCLESLRNRSAPGLRRRGILASPLGQAASTEHLESSQVSANSISPRLATPTRRPSHHSDTYHSTAQHDRLHAESSRAPQF